MVELRKRDIISVIVTVPFTDRNRMKRKRKEVKLRESEIQKKKAS